LRRATKNVVEVESYKLGSLDLNFKKHKAIKNGQEIEMTAREFDLLKYFIKHRGETISRDQLLDDVWGYDNYPITRTVDNHIAKLRQKIEIVPADPQFIITVHRMGYKFLG
jgi:DNA-binding response OmpR family regulator